MRKVVFLLVVLVCSAVGFGQDVTQGSLIAADRGGRQLGACPLKSTSVKTDISGFLARVRVVQEFENAFTEPIEAVYVFPLSQNGAVDDMTMTVGSRVVRGKIMRREEAREAYEAAKTEGKTASLLDQERPNIFTQSVANIMPGERVLIEISYVETLRYEDGAYEFVFPMTVGPRYMPAGVADAAKISPPIAATRAGHDISIEVNLNAGVPVEEIRSGSHRVQQVNLSPSVAKVTLADEKTIPNKDFILRYDVSGKRIEDAVLTHRDERGGFFTMILQPPDKIATEDRTPKEIVFVLDTSGSMSGFPIEKAKEAMRLSLEGLYPEDTFNLITFAGDTSVLFDRPVPATRANLDAAQQFLADRRGSGGTEMMTAIKAALAPSDAADHLRIVCFMTDGYVGNEEQIIAEVQQHPNARVFSFGVGSSVNRYLLDKLAEAGKGEAEYVALSEDGSKAAKKFYERVRTPMLTDISIDWNGMPVADIYPNRLTDLFSAKPVILHGRYKKGMSGTIKLKGKMAGQPYERSIAVDLPETDVANDVLATLWARTRIDELSSDKLRAAEPAQAAAFDRQIADLGLEFRLMTQFTSFVAVEDRVVNQNGKPVTMQVPVELPEGVDPAMGAGNGEMQEVMVTGSGGGGGGTTVTTSRMGNAKARKVKSAGSGKGNGRGRGSGRGSGNGSGTGAGYGSAYGANAPPPPVGKPAAAAATTTTVNVSSGVMTTTGTEAKAFANLTTDTKVNTTVSSAVAEQIPKGVNFNSLLKLTPGAVPYPMGSTFQIDGASGSENTFVVDGSEVTGLRTGMVNTNNSLPLTGRAPVIAEPVYPSEAKAAKALGEVEVAVKIDREGTVTEAKAVSGPGTLRKAAEAAAMLSKFAPVLVEGSSVRVSGSMVYNFVSSKKTEISIRKMKAEPRSAEDLRAAAVAAKTHFWIQEVIDRLARGEKAPGVNEVKFVRDGKAAIRIDLTASSPAVLAKLQAAGFEMLLDKGNGSVSGSIVLDKLAALADIDEVKLVLPRM